MFPLSIVCAIHSYRPSFSLWLSLLSSFLCSGSSVSAHSSLSPSFPLSATWRSLHRHPAGWHAAWHRLGHEVSVRHGLRSPRPGSSKHPGQQQSGVQSVRLRPVPSPGGWPGGCLHHDGTPDTALLNQAAATDLLQSWVNLNEIHPHSAFSKLGFNPFINMM